MIQSPAITRRAMLKQAAITTLAAPWLATMRELAAAEPDLKITGVEPYVIRDGWRRLFVLVRTNAGVTGLGEASPMNAGAQADLIRWTFGPLVKGMNPLDIERCWERMYYRTYKQGPMGLQPECIAGVDIALWDILGKVTGLPVSQLLGGRRRDSVRLYSSIGRGGDGSVDHYVRAATEDVDRGFTAVKIRLDRGAMPPDRMVAEDIRIFRAVRKAIGDDVEMMVDINNGYSYKTAVRVGRVLEELGVIHYEEPLAQTDYPGYRRLVDAIDVPVAAGEHEYTRWQFRDLIDQANPDILQPDLVKSAGISESVKIAALASAHHKPLVPHQTQPTIGQAANLHYVSALVAGDTAQELNRGSLDSAMHQMFTNPLQFTDGRMPVPDGPGLGLEIDEDKLKEMTL